jgi:hypothetical protein
MPAQGVPTLADQSGTISGVLKDAGGRPAPGVRVGAIAAPDSAAEIASASAMVSLAATDENGKYRLENIPPGRYYIAAGRVDFPTYYPGTQALARGTMITITPKAIIEGIDFSMLDSSARTAGADSPSGNSALSFYVDVEVRVEGGGKIPVFSPNGFSMIRLINTSNGVRADIPINAPILAVPSPTTEFKVTIENLPTGYEVKSITAGGGDIKNSTLKLSTLNFAPSPANSNLMNASTRLSVVLGGAGSVSLGPSGVRVTGRAADKKRHSIYLSGRPGMFYSDGSFEFRGVPAGRHTLMTIENPESPRPLGASVIVRDRDLEDIELAELALLPNETTVISPASVGAAQPAGIVRLASLRIRVVDGSDNQPTGPGTVYVLGPRGTSIDLPSDGHIEFAHLLPGTYRFEIRVFRHETITRTVVVGEEDTDLQFEAASVD